MLLFYEKNDSVSHGITTPRPNGYVQRTTQRIHGDPMDTCKARPKGSTQHILNKPQATWPPLLRNAPKLQNTRRPQDSLENTNIKWPTPCRLTFASYSGRQFPKRDKHHKSRFPDFISILILLEQSLCFRHLSDRSHVLFWMPPIGFAIKLPEALPKPNCVSLV